MWLTGKSRSAGMERVEAVAGGRCGAGWRGEMSSSAVSARCEVPVLPADLRNSGGDPSWPKNRPAITALFVVLGFELPVVRRNEGTDVVGLIQQPKPLLFI